MASARATPKYRDGFTPPSSVHTLPPAKMTDISHHLDFLLFINCITCFSPCLKSQWALEGVLGRQGGSGRLGRLHPMHYHPYHCLGVTTGTKCQPHICPNAFPGSAIPSRMIFVVGSHPCRGLAAVPAYPYGSVTFQPASGTHFLVPAKGFNKRHACITHGQQPVPSRSCPITSWGHPGADTTAPTSWEGQAKQ